MDSPKADDSMTANAVAVLTPRSKIKAMMAQVDDNSDNDGINATSRHLYGDVDSSGFKTNVESSAEESEASDLPLPKGRLARRLEASSGGPGSKQPPSSESEAEIGNAYERLRREMQKEQQQNESRSRPQTGNEAHDQAPTQVSVTRPLFTKNKLDVFVSPGDLQITGQADDDGERPSRNTNVNNDLYEATDREISSPKVVVENNSDSDSEAAPKKGASEGFLALVAKKRAERKAREAVLAQARRERRKRLEQTSDKLEEMLAEDEGADAEDPAASRILSSQVRPSRRAGKKAREEISRETQRMSRNMQLTHDAKTRKKYTMQDLFKKLGWNQNGTISKEPETQNAGSSPPSSSRPTSDVEPDHMTPPTSPVSPAKSSKNSGDVSSVLQQTNRLPIFLADETHLDDERMDEELPTVDYLLAMPPAKEEQKDQNTNISDATAASVATSDTKEGDRHPKGVAQHFRVKTVGISKSITSLADSDLDSDLDITPVNPLIEKLDRVFANVPAKRTESDGKTKLKALAHLTSPTKRDKRFTKNSVPPGQMNANLQRKARQQAALEKLERIEELKAKGIIVQTAEEREKEQALTEDLLEKARREVEELTRREKEERKKNNADKAEGQLSAMEVDESEDESYKASDDNSDADDENDDREATDVEIALSGSEDDEEDEGDNEENEENQADKNLFDEEASDDEDEIDHESKTVLSQFGKSGELEPAAQARSGRRRRQVIIDEDDIDEERSLEELPPTQNGLLEAESPLVVNPFAKPNQANAIGAAPMGLSQAFAATMDNSQLYEDDGVTQMSSIMSAPMPEPDLPIIDQRRASMQDIAQSLPNPDLSQPSLPSTQYPTQYTQPLATQFSEMPEPTQDDGIISKSPLAKRFNSVPPSTVDTVLIVEQSDQNNDQSGPKKKGKLIRRQVEAQSRLEMASDAETTHVPGKTEVRDAYAALKKAEHRRMKEEAFNKKRSNAKEMVEEQAEESEDEYAGLGGASDEESGGEMDDETRKMLDDGTVELNESQLAAFHANKERAADEKAIEKLYKDINSGMLRRKRGVGGDFDDLSDSDEELERRRRLNRAQFAKMRKALLEDENVGKIAENPKKAAFLKAIEDREFDDDTAGFLDEPDLVSDLVREDSLQEVPDSQPRASASIEEDSPVDTGIKRKRPLKEMDPNTRPPATARRTEAKIGRKPVTMADIRESVSFLVEEPHMQGVVQVAATPSSDVEDNVESSDFADRRRSNPVVDRLTLKRVESAESASTASGKGRLAFFARGQSDQADRVPALLRRATTQNTSGGEVSYSTERMAGNKGRGDGEFVRRGGGKKSNLAYFARDAERRKAVDKVEMRRNNERKKATEGRRGILKGLGGGTFDY